MCVVKKDGARKKESEDVVLPYFYKLEATAKDRSFSLSRLSVLIFGIKILLSDLSALSCYCEASVTWHGLCMLKEILQAVYQQETFPW